eukprot:6180861-Prymnesium_polylepis.1
MHTAPCAPLAHTLAAAHHTLRNLKSPWPFHLLQVAPAAFAARRGQSRRRLIRAHCDAPWSLYSVHIDLGCKLQ